MRINYPRVIQNGKQTKSLPVLSASLTQSIKPLSTASIVLPEGTQMDCRTFVEMYTITGSAGVFRTRAPKVGIGAQRSTVDLEHAIAELGDYLIAAEVEKETTIAAAIKDIFSWYKGPSWKLGSIAKETTKVVYKADYDNCLDAIQDILEQEPSLMLSFNFASYPWTVSVTARGTKVAAEGRLSRNVKSAMITEDDTEHCTRVYLDGLPGTTKSKYGHVDADTIGIYGVIEREISGPNGNATQAKRTADLYLQKHKHPRYSIQIEALELSSLTGETLDKLQIGKLYRLALPDYNLTVEETITQIYWPNIYDAPTSASVTLSEEEDTVLEAIKSSSKAGRSAGKKVEKKSKEYSTRFEQNEHNIDLWAGKTDKQGKILEEAGLYIDSSGILQYATDKVNGIESRIEQRAGKIEQKITSTKEGLESKISQQKDRIDLSIRKANNALTQISVLDGKIELKVDKNGVISSINQTSEAITINASKINLEGYVKATDITADYICTKLQTATNVVVKKLTLSASGSISLPIDGGSISITGARAVDFINSLQITSSGNTYKLQKKTLGDSTWTDVGSFSRAVSSWTWGGGSGKINVTALPQNQTKSVNVSIDGTSTITANGSYTYTVDYENSDGDDVSTGATKTITVNVPAEQHTHSLSITRAGWHSTSGNVYYGKLYYWDDDDKSYSPVVNQNRYWYYSGTSKSGTTTVWY